MAVQIPDPGTGNGQTGDNEYVFRKKVKDNFTDKTNAASRLVGKSAGDLMEVGSFGLGGKLAYTILGSLTEREFVDELMLQGTTFFRANTPNPLTHQYSPGVFMYGSDTFSGITLDYLGSGVRGFAGRSSSGSNLFVYNFWTSRNATKDGNGFLKAASPIVKVFADKAELNTDAESQNVTYKKNGVGDYTITTASGLSTDGWYIELPKDMNGNPKVAVTLSEVDGVISLRSYKRMFSMETFTFVPDLNEPLDVPDGRWIDLRLNEIPVEPSEPESEV